MTKIKIIFASLVLLLVLVAAPVSAQEPIDVDPDELTSLEAETADVESEEESETAGVPETGIAPQENPLLANTAVFAGGATLGALIGLGVVQKRRKANNS